MSPRAEPTILPREPASWFLIMATLAMALWCALFFDHFVVAMRQVLGYALAGPEGWSGARLAAEDNGARRWLSFAAFALLGSGVAIGVVRRQRWAARALLMLWCATLPVMGLVAFVGFAAVGQCVAETATFPARLRCVGVVGGLALVPVVFWLFAFGHIRRARALWQASD